MTGSSLLRLSFSPLAPISSATAFNQHLLLRDGDIESHAPGLVEETHGHMVTWSAARGSGGRARGCGTLKVDTEVCVITL